MMKLSYRDPGGLDARVVLTSTEDTVLPRLLGWDGWIVSSIQTDPHHRGRGAGTRLVQLVCAEADREQVALYVVAVPAKDCPLQRDELVEWYGRFGFTRRTHSLTNLERRPRDWRATAASCVTLDINDPAHHLEVVRGSKVMCTRCHMHTHDGKIAARVRAADRRRRLNEVIDLT